MTGRRRKEICAAGHPMSGDNIKINPTSGFRYCRACHNRYRRNAYRRLHPSEAMIRAQVEHMEREAYEQEMERRRNEAMAAWHRRAMGQN